MNTKLNLGGGDHWYQDGWLNLDQTTGYKLDERLLTEFENNSIEKIFFSHTLEHLQIDIARQILINSYRILKTDGIIRIVVPDCELFAKAYLSNDEKYFLDNDKLKPHFKDLTHATIELGGNKANFHKESCVGHYFFWDTWSITWLLLCADFRNIKVQSFGKSQDVEMSEIATMEPKSGMPIRGFDNPLTKVISTYIEAIK